MGCSSSKMWSESVAAGDHYPLRYLLRLNDTRLGRPKGERGKVVGRRAFVERLIVFLQQGDKDRHTQHILL